MPEHNREYPNRAYDPARRVEPSTGWSIHPNWGDRGPSTLATETGAGGVLYGPVEPSDFQRERLANKPGAGYRSSKSSGLPRRSDVGQLTYNASKRTYDYGWSP